MIDWLIDWLEFYTVSAIFQPVGTCTYPIWYKTINWLVIHICDGGHACKYILRLFWLKNSKDRLKISNILTLNMEFISGLSHDLTFHE